MLYHWKASAENYRAEKACEARCDADKFARIDAILSNITDRLLTKSQWVAYYSENRKRLAYQKRFDDWQQENHEKKTWLTASSICPTCSREISNRAYWEGRKASAHLRGTCKPDTFFPVKIPRQSWKSKLTITVAMPTYRRTHDGGISVQGYNIKTVEDLCKFWGVNNMAGTIKLPKKQQTQKAA